MAYWTHTKDPIGAFVEKDAGNTFEYSINDDEQEWCSWNKEYPHKVWVGGAVNDWGFRYAVVKKTVAYIVTDEDEYGRPVVQKWQIKSQRDYV